MLLYRKQTYDVSHGLVTLQNACSIRSTPVICEDSGTFHSQAATVEINASEIQTALIQITGRFCERFGSDLLCTLSDLDPFLRLQDPPDEPQRWVIGIGIRASGVDGDTFIRNRLLATRHDTGLVSYVFPEQIYRKLLCLDIQDVLTETAARRIIQLKDVTHTVTRMAEEDIGCRKEDVNDH